MLKNRVVLKGAISGIEVGKRASIKIDAITGDQWIDLAYWLEAVSFMANQAMQSKNMTKPQMIEYITKYLEDSVIDD